MLPTAIHFPWKQILAGDLSSPDPVLPTLVPIRLTSAVSPIEVPFASGIVLRFPVDARPEVIAAIMRTVALPCWASHPTSNSGATELAEQRLGSHETVALITQY